MFVYVVCSVLPLSFFESGNQDDDRDGDHATWTYGWEHRLDDVDIGTRPKACPSCYGTHLVVPVLAFNDIELLVCQFGYKRSTEHTIAIIFHLHGTSSADWYSLCQHPVRAPCRWKITAIACPCGPLSQMPFFVLYHKGLQTLYQRVRTNKMTFNICAKLVVLNLFVCCILCGMLWTWSTELVYKLPVEDSSSMQVV